jgi:hypothetical protein
VNKWRRKQAGREALGETDTVSGSILGGSDEELPLSYGIAVGDGCVALRGRVEEERGLYFECSQQARLRPVWRPLRLNVV